MKKSKFTHSGQALMALVMAAAAPLVVADPVSWIGGDGAWESTANWSGGALPTANDFVDLPFLVAVSSNAGANLAKELTNRAVLAVNAGKLTITGTADNYGALTVNGGAALDAGRINIDSSAAFAVNGAGSAVNVVQGVFNYGAWNMGGASTLNAESFDNFGTLGFAGGAVATANSMINHGGNGASIADANSALVIHGNLTNDGAITVLSNARLQTDSIDNNNFIHVQNATLATASLKNVSTAGPYSSVLVDGSESHFIATDFVTNDFSFEVDGGHANIAYLANNGRAMFTDAHLEGQDLGNTNQLGFGGASSAALSGQILNSGVVSISAHSEVRADRFQQTAGETYVEGGTLGASSEFGVQILGGDLRGHGAIDGKLVLDADGVLTPGDSSDATQRFTVAGGLALLGGRFNVDLGGTDSADYDVLDALGAASLGGTLQVSLLSGYMPVLGDAFDIILADSISGAFGSILLPTLGDGLKFTTINGGTFFRLQVAAVPLPTPALLLGGALGVLGWAGRRRARVD